MTQIIFCRTSLKKFSFHSRLLSFVPLLYHVRQTKGFFQMFVSFPVPFIFTGRGKTTIIEEQKLCDKHYIFGGHR